MVEKENLVYRIACFLQLEKIYQICFDLIWMNFFVKYGVWEPKRYRNIHKDELNKTKQFYYKNQDRVNNCINLFSDDYSKQIYKKAVLFRSTYLKKDRPEKCIDQEYFNSLIPKLNDNEVFIDCGAYDGDTIKKYVQFSCGKYQKIIAFEPDKANFEKLSKLVEEFSDVTIINKGVWNSSEGVCFSNNGSVTSKVVLNNNIEDSIVIDTIRIDDAEECKNASFIKMDIEGAELNALNGALNTIVKNRPILTVCLYHTDEDMLSIPEWMSQHLDDYSFYCRHHSYQIPETIIYAIPKERQNN